MHNFVHFHICEELRQKGEIYHLQLLTQSALPRIDQNQFIAMKKLVIQRYGRLPKLVTSSIPSPAQSQFLIRMKYAPINPSDLGYLFGVYGIRRQVPYNIGFEGSGIIEGAQDRKLIGKKVSILVPRDSSEGTYSTHIVVPIQSTIVWPDNIDLKQASCAMVNPLTALCFRRLVEQLGYQSVVLSAANSQLSRMVIRHFSKNKVASIKGIVRSQSQIEQLTALGADQILTDSSSFEQLRSLEPSVFFDAVGGPLSSTIFNSLPPLSWMVVYGNLSKQTDSTVNVSQLLFGNKTVTGFWLSRLLERASKEDYQQLKQTVVNNHEDFQTRINRQFSLQQYQEAFHEALKKSAPGKILLNM